MASNESQKPHECQICLNLYDDDRRPRSTACGHTFCTGCLEDSLKFGTMKCPRCRKEQTALSVNSLPINYDMEALIAYMNHPLGTKSRDSKPSTAIRGIPHRLQIMKDEQEQEARHLLASEEYCDGIDNYECVLEQCLNIPMFFMSNQNLKSSLSAVRNELDRVAVMQEKYTEKRENLEDQLEIAKTLDTTESIVNYIDGTDQRIVELQEVIKAQSETAANAKAMLKAVEEEKHSQSVSDRVVKFSKYLKPLTTSLIEACLTGSVATYLDVYYGKKIVANDLKPLTPRARQLIEAQRVYAVHEHDGTILSAKLDILDGKVLLYAFQKQAPPAGTQTLPFSELVSLLNLTSTVVFLFMSWGLVNADGYVFININQDKAYARQFFMLCSGQQGISYRKSKSYKIFGGFGESLYCGKFENDRDKEASTLIKGLRAGDEYFWPYEKGSIAGAGGDGPEFIIINDRWTLLPYWHKTGFGSIDSGMDYIGHAISACREDLSKIEIAECGVVLATV